MNKFVIVYYLVPCSLLTQTNFVTNNIFQTDYFIENNGQFKQELDTKNRIYYSSQMEFGRLMFHKNGLTIKQYKVKRKLNDNTENRNFPSKPETNIINFEWVGANPNCQIIPSEKSKHYFTFGTENYTSYGFKELRYVNMYPNIDIIYTIEDNMRYHYSIILHKGSNLSDIKLKINGGSIQLNNNKKELKFENISNPLREYGLKARTLNDTSVNILVNYTVEDNIVGFNLDKKIISEDIEIDPWISLFKRPLGNNANVYMGYDVEYDNEGNLLVFGGSTSPIYENLVAKYDTSGNLLWTFDCTFIFPWGEGKIGNFIVDKRDNKLYLNQGTSSGDHGCRVLRYKKTGIYDSFITKDNDSLTESWDMQFNVLKNELIVFGGGTLPFGTAAKLAFNNDKLIMTNFTGVKAGYQDIVSSCMDETGYLYVLIASNVTNAVNNKIFKINSNINDNIWSKFTGNSNFIELSNKEKYSPYLLGSSNGYNALSVNKKYLFYYDGYNLKAFDKINGDDIGNGVVLPNYSPRSQGGIESDDCNNIFIGGNNGNVLVYNFNGVNFNFVKEFNFNGYAGKRVFDLKIDRSQNKLYISGESFVAKLNLNVCDSNDFNYIINTNCTNYIFAEITQPFPGAIYDYIWSDTLNNTVVKQTLNSTLPHDTLSYNFGKAIKLTIYRKSAIRPTKKSELVYIRRDTAINHINTIACNSYSIGNHIYNKSGIYRDTLKNHHGCDSFIILLNLTIRKNSDTLIMKEICESEPYLFKGKYLSQSGTYIDTLKNVYGCDSIVTLNLIVHSNINYIMDTLCLGDSIFVNGKIIKNSIVYLDTITRKSGCDSILDVNLKFINCDSNIECKRILIPTAFSPNNDLINDKFLPILKSDKIRIIDFEVYNRFGNLVYRFIQNSDGWDGSYNDLNSPSGVYTYFVKFNCNGLIYNYSGNVMLIR